MQGLYDAAVLRLGPNGNDLEFGTLLAGAEGDSTDVIAALPTGELVVCGTATTGFVLPKGGAQDVLEGSADAFVVVLSADGSELAASTFLGGSEIEDCDAMAIDTDGTIVVIGGTESNDFPTTAGAYAEATSGAADIYIARLSPGLDEVVFGTYFGTSADDYSSSSRLAFTEDGGIVFVANVRNAELDLTEGALQTTHGGADDGVVVILEPDGSTLRFATLLGGDGSDYLRSVHVIGEWN